MWKILSRAWGQARQNSERYPMRRRGVHTSVPPDLKNIIRALEKRDDVTRVILGPIEAARHRYPAGHLRYAMDMPGGIKARGYLGGGVMEVYIYCEDVETIREYLEKNS